MKIFKGLVLESGMDPSSFTKLTIPQMRALSGETRGKKRLVNPTYAQMVAFAEMVKKEAETKLPSIWSMK